MWRVSLLTLAVVLPGCARKPAPRATPGVVIEIAKDGSFTAGGEELTKERLFAFLKKEAGKSARDADGLPVIGVTISAHPECEYDHVQDAMVQCMRAYICNVSWEMEGRWVDVALPKDPDEDHPVYIHEEVEPAEVEGKELGTIDLSELQDKTLRKAIVDRPVASGNKGGSAESRAGPAPREDPSPEHVVVLRGSEVPPELRVKVYWANARGQVIHSPGRALPPEYTGARAPLSTEGAHVAIKINRMPCADLDDLARKLERLVFSTDNPRVVLDPRRAVPFKWAFGALEACGAAGAGKIRFQSPPVGGQGGSDWWWM